MLASTVETTIFSHQYPVWQGIADHLVTARVVDDDAVVMEQLWAKKVGDEQYIICCIPALAYDISLGDVVQVDGDLIIVKTVRPSGRLVYRIWSEGGWDGKHELLDEIARLGGLMETCTFSLTSVDAADREIAQGIVEYLSRMEAAGNLVYEAGFRG